VDGNKNAAISDFDDDVATLWPKVRQSGACLEAFANGGQRRTSDVGRFAMYDFRAIITRSMLPASKSRLVEVCQRATLRRV